jgi:DNA-binding transcriptional LysR family regulator
VALRGTTTGASALVPLSQSATSAALNELERSLGAKLFDRIGKRLLINDSGRALLPAALAVLDGAHSIEGTFGEMQASGVVDLRICASTTVGTYVLPSLLARYRSEPIHLSLKIGNTQEVVAAVSDFDVDLGFIEGRLARPRAGAQRGPRDPSVPSALTVGSNEAIRNCVIEGLGISCLSRYVVRDDLAAGRLRIMTTQLPRFTRQFTIIHHRKKLLSESLQRFIGQCRGYAADTERSERERK